MELIFEYDKFRLKNYQIVQKNINFLNDQNIQAFCFPDLNYFNYTFQPENRVFSIKEINTASDFFLESGIKKFKIISSEPLPEDIGKHYRKTNTFVKHVYNGLPISFPKNNLSFQEVNEGKIDLFTETYLKGFEAGKKDIKKVSRNFSQLLNQPCLNLFLMEAQNQAVGVLVLYQNGNKSLLAGGAVLPELRNKSYHKQGIQFRLNKVLNDSPNQSIESWTYLGSTSYLNMIACGLEPIKYFSIFEPII